jgi:hypothetical protein
MSNSPASASDTAKGAKAPDSLGPAKPAPQQNQDNKPADAKPAQQQK